MTISKSLKRLEESQNLAVVVVKKTRKAWVAKVVSGPMKGWSGTIPYSVGSWLGQEPKLGELATLSVSDWWAKRMKK